MSSSNPHIPSNSNDLYTPQHFINNNNNHSYEQKHHHHHVNDENSETNTNMEMDNLMLQVEHAVSALWYHFGNKESMGFPDLLVEEYWIPSINLLEDIVNRWQPFLRPEDVNFIRYSFNSMYDLWYSLTHSTHHQISPFMQIEIGPRMENLKSQIFPSPSKESIKVGKKRRNTSRSSSFERKDENPEWFEQKVSAAQEASNRLKYLQTLTPQQKHENEVQQLLMDLQMIQQQLYMNPNNTPLINNYINAYHELYERGLPRLIRHKYYPISPKLQSHLNELKPQFQQFYHELVQIRQQQQQQQ